MHLMHHALQGKQEVRKAVFPVFSVFLQFSSKLQVSVYHLTVAMRRLLLYDADLP